MMKNRIDFLRSINIFVKDHKFYKFVGVCKLDIGSYRYDEFVALIPDIKITNKTRIDVDYNSKILVTKDEFNENFRTIMEEDLFD